jgi:hypothetical protein
MKINFKHPVTKKPSSVILPDIWLRSWYLSMNLQPADVPLLVFRLAREFYLDENKAQGSLGLIYSTFTQYCMAVISTAVYDSLLLSLDLSGILQSRLIATPGKGKAVSRSENKIRARPVYPEQSLGSDL